MPSGSSPEPGGEAAVALPRLRLQLLLRERPEWRGRPVAVVADEAPNAPLLELSREAVQRGLRPGLRLGAARNLDLELCSAAVSEARMGAAADGLAEGLTTFSPRVERCDGRGGPLAFAGTFFVDPTGLEGIYGTRQSWADAVHRYLTGRGFHSAVVVGRHPHRCLVLARCSSGARVLTEDEERSAVDAVSLRRAGLAERLCGPLARLGVGTVGDLLQLSEEELSTRFGEEAAALHRLLAEGAQLPLQARRPVTALESRATLEPPTADVDRLAFVLKRAIDALIRQVDAEHRVLASTLLELRLEGYGRDRRGQGRKLAAAERRVVETLEPAAPSRDGRVWMDLWRLRLGELELLAPVEGIALRGESVDPDAEQLVTTALAPPRDPRVASDALARVAAILGAERVGRLDPRDAHLPEAVVRLGPLGATPWAQRPAARIEAGLQGVRRLGRPRRLASDGRWPSTPSPVAHADGPHRMSGGWWAPRAGGRAVSREYWYLHLDDGQIWWVFHDRVRARWYLHAKVG